MSIALIFQKLFIERIMYVQLTSLTNSIIPMIFFYRNSLIETSLECWFPLVTLYTVLSQDCLEGFHKVIFQEKQFLFCFFSVRLQSVLCGHLVFSSPPQRPMTSDFKGFSIPDFIHYIFFPYRASIFPFECSLLNNGNYWYHFYNIFGMTRSLTGD